MDDKSVTWTVTKIGQRQYRALVHFADKYGRATAYEYMMSNYQMAVSKAAAKARELRETPRP